MIIDLRTPNTTDKHLDSSASIHSTDSETGKILLILVQICWSSSASCLLMWSAVKLRHTLDKFLEEAWPKTWPFSWPIQALLIGPWSAKVRGSLVTGSSLALDLQSSRWCSSRLDSRRAKRSRLKLRWFNLMIERFVIKFRNIFLWKFVILFQ